MDRGSATRTVVETGVAAAGAGAYLITLQEWVAYLTLTYVSMQICILLYRGFVKVLANSEK